MNQPPLKPDAERVAIALLLKSDIGQSLDFKGTDVVEVVQVAVSAYLAAALPEVTSKVEAFINQRPEYIQALKNTRSGDDMSDYSRWNGHAESRRKLAQTLGWTVPHNPGETTRPEVNDA